MRRPQTFRRDPLRDLAILNTLAALQSCPCQRHRCRRCQGWRRFLRANGRAR